MCVVITTWTWGLLLKIKWGKVRVNIVEKHVTIPKTPFTFTTFCHSSSYIFELYSLFIKFISITTKNYYFELTNKLTMPFSLLEIVDLLLGKMNNELLP